MVLMVLALRFPRRRVVRFTGGQTARFSAAVTTAEKGARASVACPQQSRRERRRLGGEPCASRPGPAYSSPAALAARPVPCRRPGLLVVRLKFVGAAGVGVDLAALVAAPLLLGLLVPEVLAPHLQA